MKAFLVLFVATSASAQVLLPFGTPLPYTVPSVADAFPASQFHAQGEGGQVSFGHSSVQQTRSEVRLPSGQVLGHYSYVDPDGEPAITYYEAGPSGYRVVGSNRLPVAPEANLEAPVDEGVAPEPVQYTQEVVEARAEFDKKFQEAKNQERTKRHVFLPNLFTDLEKVEDTNVVSTYSGGEPGFAYAFTVQPQPLPTLKTTAEVPLVYSTFPFVPVPAKPTEEKASRRRREVQVPLPYLHVVPATSSATFTTSQFETVDAKTPADTTKLDLVTKEHKVQFPTYSVVQPVAQGKPVTYSAVTSPFVTSSIVTYPFVHTPFVPVKSE